MNQIWKHVLLGEVFESITNGVNCDQKSNTGKQLVTRIETISKGVFNLERIGRADLTEKDLSKYRMKENDILFSHINSPIHVGKTALFEIDEEVYHGVNLLRIRTIKEVEPKFLRYFLLLLYTSGFWRTVAKQSVNQASVNQKDISAVPFSYPTLEKQREIVKKLDSAFADIDLLEENLKLSDQKSKQLLQSILSGLFANSGVKHEPGGTLSDQRQTSPSVALKDFCKMYQPPTISTKEMIPSGEYVVYGANGPIGRYNKFNHEEPQLLVTCRGATCGAVNMSEPFAWINGNAMVIQPNLDLATLEYMKYAFLGGIDVSSSITGSAQPQITRTTLEVIKVPLPSLDRQLEIVEKLDFVFTEIEVLRSRLKLKKDFVGALRQSLLSGAFNQEKEVA